MPLTINDIARIAGVSKATVSRVINGKVGVNPKTRETVLALTKELNFQPSALAKAISERTTCCIALVSPYGEDEILSNPIYSEIIRGVATALATYNFYSLICFSNSLEYVSNLYLQKRVDGYIIICPNSSQRELIDCLSEMAAPFIIASAHHFSDEARQFPFVDVDNFSAASMAVNHLIKLGHSRIAHVTVEQGGATQTGQSVNCPYPIVIRKMAYQDAIERAGLPYDKDLIAFSESVSMQDGFQAMKRLLKKGTSFSAVFAATDLLAIGALKAIREHGLRVPEDISLIGFDGITLCQYTDPTLTTIRQNGYLRGKAAAQVLMEHLVSGEEMNSALIAAEFVQGGSTAPYQPR